MSIEVILYDRIYIPEEGVPEKVYAKIKSDMTIMNPKYSFYKKSGFSTRKVPKLITFYKELEGYLVIPTGKILSVISYFDFYKVDYTIVDRRVSSGEIDFSFNPKLKLNPHQEQILGALDSAEYNSGLIQSPPGSGKTFTCLAYIARIKKPTLIIVHEEMLLDQWIEEIESVGVGEFTVGTYKGKEKNFGDITVALVQSSSRSIGKTFVKEFSGIACVIVDETHRAAAQSYTKVLNHLPAKYKIGVSGTLKRRDRMDFIISFFIGDTLIEIPDHVVQERISDFTVEFVETGLGFDVPRRRMIKRKEDKGKFMDPNNFINVDYNAVCSNLAGFASSDRYEDKTLDEIVIIGYNGKSGERNRIIVNKIVEDIKRGHKVLILTRRRMHAVFFREALKKEGYNGLVLISGEGVTKEGLKDLRKDMVEDFIVATNQKAEEGLDIKDLSSIHLTMPQKNPEKLKQSIARVRRNKDKKMMPVVRDYVDFHDNHSGKDYYKDAQNVRSKLYQKWKEEYHEE